ncbi:unnamed protein product [Rodentolepis nana]|uniref:TORC_N domain-containing protein n=1 Tax=Rodentolepis nana TaxID=102285 RepID=A0A0R3T5Q6_RODNA|nr:unnamed protein product [Rodentolepis nana]
MSSQDLHTFASKSSNNTSGIIRPSKLPLFGRRSSDKHPPPPTSQSPVCTTLTTTTPCRVRPSTTVKPFFASHYQPNTSVNESQRRRLPPSQPNTAVRNSQPETSQGYQRAHLSSNLLRSSGSSVSSTSKKTDSSSGVIPQSLSFSGSRNVQQNSQLQQQNKSSTSKSKSYRMENMSVEHLQYLERRLQQLLEVIPSRPGKAKSDSGQQSSYPSWMAVPPPPPGHSLHQSHQALPHYPMITNPYHFHHQAGPTLLIFPPRQHTGPPQSTTGRSVVFGELDPYYLSSSSSASFCYAGSETSSLQDFNREEVIRISNTF